MAAASKPQSGSVPPPQATPPDNDTGPWWYSRRPWLRHRSHTRMVPAVSAVPRPVTQITEPGTVHYRASKSSSPPGWSRRSQRSPGRSPRSPSRGRCTTAPASPVRPRSNSRLPTTLNARDQPPAEVSDQRVSGLTGAVHSCTSRCITTVVCCPCGRRATSASQPASTRRRNAACLRCYDGDASPEIALLLPRIQYRSLTFLVTAACLRCYDGDASPEIALLLPRIQYRSLTFLVTAASRSNQASKVASQSRYRRSDSLSSGPRCRPAARSCTSRCITTVVCCPCGRRATSASQPASTRRRNAKSRRPVLLT